MEDLNYGLFKFHNGVYVMQWENGQQVYGEINGGTFYPHVKL